MTIFVLDFLNKWIITKVILEHNHELVPKLAKKISTNHKIPYGLKRNLNLTMMKGLLHIKI
jgi:hypothetical protein